MWNWWRKEKSWWIYRVRRAVQRPTRAPVLGATATEAPGWDGDSVSPRLRLESLMTTSTAHVTWMRRLAGDAGSKAADSFRWQLLVRAWKEVAPCQSVVKYSAVFRRRLLPCFFAFALHEVDLAMPNNVRVLTQSHSKLGTFCKTGSGLARKTSRDNARFHSENTYTY